MRRRLPPFYDIILPMNHVFLTLDGVTTFLRIINLRNTCKRLRYSQAFGEISSVQQCNGRQLEESEGFFFFFFFFFFIISCLLETK